MHHGIVFPLFLLPIFPLSISGLLYILFSNLLLTPIIFGSGFIDICFLCLFLHFINSLSLFFGVYSNVSSYFYPEKRERKRERGYFRFS